MNSSSEKLNPSKAFDTKQDYLLFKENIVRKYHKFFPINNIPFEIINEYNLKNILTEGKKDNIIITLNNIFFRLRKAHEI